MNKETVKWIFRNFFVIAAIVFILIYLRWFQLTPFVIPDYEDFNSDYRGGLFFLAVFIFFTMISRFVTGRKFWHILLSVITAIPFTINLLVIYLHMPRIEDTARYNGITYYVTRNHPMLDYWHSYSQLTKWTGFLKYERVHLGKPQFRKQIIYDETTNRVIIRVNESSEMLVYIDGEPEQYYETGTQIDNQLYFPAYECIGDPVYTYLCKSHRWSIYQCELDNSSCKRLPFEYHGDFTFETTNIEKNNATKEINVYLDIGNHPGVRTLIFTWGEQPRCHAEGCKTLEK